MPTIYVGPMDAMANAMLDGLRGINFAETALYLGFLTTGPTDSAGAGVVELAHADYARKLVSWSPASARGLQAAADVTFTNGATSDWNGGNPIRMFGLWSAATGGDLRLVDILQPALTVTSGSPVVIPSSQIRILHTPAQEVVA